MPSARSAWGIDIGNRALKAIKLVRDGDRFRVDDFDDALSRARVLVDRLEEEPRMNPATGTREFALRDPDGYYVMVSAL